MSLTGRLSQYWNWGKYSDDPESSPISDGSAYSMSGNGAFVPGRNNCIFQHIRRSRSPL